METVGSEIARGQHDQELRLDTARAVVLWILFFLICFGLGYPGLIRYDARKLGPDWVGYYDTVLQRNALDNFPFSERVLVTSVARPFYLMARGRLGNWDPVWFGLLVSNCLFAASAALLLLLIGLRVTRNLPLALFCCTLYLLNYVVSNLWLSGMVDAAEACMMLMVTWALFTDRWWLLPVIGVLGGVAKQSFLPFGAVFAATWWFVAERPVRRYSNLAWVASLTLTSAIAVILVHRTVAGQTAAPWTIAREWNSQSNYLRNLLHCFTDRQFWYAFAWLLPLGVWRLNRLPRPWVAASLASGVVALALAGYANLIGTVNRPLFTLIGPVLTASTVLLLADRRVEV